MKKLMLSILPLVLSLSLFPTAAFAEYTEGTLKYEVNDGSITITGCFGRDSTVVIPSSIAGYPVNTIGTGAFSDNTYVKIVVYPKNITNIQEGAFAEGISVVQDTSTIESVYFGGNYSLVKYVPIPELGSAFTYDGENSQMYSKEDGSGKVAFYRVIEKDATVMQSKIAKAETDVAYDSLEKGDINGSGVINIVDAQCALDISDLKYEGFSALSADSVIRADANEDLIIDATDARAIQYRIHNGHF